MQECRSEFLCACMRIAPAVNSEVSVMMKKGQVMSGIWRTGAEEKTYLNFSKASC